MRGAPWGRGRYARSGSSCIWQTEARDPSLSVDVLVTVIQGVDILLGKTLHGTALASDVDGTCHVLAHHRGLDGGLGGGSDGDHTVITHQYARGPRTLQGREDGVVRGGLTEERGR